MDWRVNILALAFLASACAGSRPPAPPPPPADQAVIEDGREIAQTQCASCHAVGTSGASPNAAAPAFRTVLSRYHADVLRQELIEGIRVTHPMPDFQFNPQGVDALLAYLQSIQRPPGPHDLREPQ